MINYFRYATYAYYCVRHPKLKLIQALSSSYFDKNDYFDKSVMQMKFSCKFCEFVAVLMHFCSLASFSLSLGSTLLRESQDQATYELYGFCVQCKS